MMRYTGSLNMDIRVVSLPGDKDPDDLIREDPDAWRALIEQAVPVAEYVIWQGTAHLTSQSSYPEREAVARELLPILTATESDLQRSGNIQALARRVRIDERILIQWTQRRQAVRTRSTPTVREQRQLADRPAPVPLVGGPPGQSMLWEAFCLHLLLQQPERLWAANRKLRELQAQAPMLAEELEPLNASDFTRPDYQAVFRALEQSLDQDEIEPLEYLTQHLPAELLAVVDELYASPLETFRQRTSKVWTTELDSILRDLARINAQAEPGTDLLIQEVLMLRHSRLERESRELYFLQQDSQTLNGNLTDHQYHFAVSANLRARQLLAKALHQMKSFARDL